MIVVRTA